jgi:hypothetical protein
VVAFDFDNTLTRGHGDFPIPAPVIPAMLKLVRFLQKCGIYCILWTCREGKSLEMAVDLLRENGVRMDGVNSSIHVCPFEFEPRKIYAHVYVDDRNVFWHHRNTNDAELALVVFDSIMNKIGIQTDHIMGTRCAFTMYLQCKEGMFDDEWFAKVKSYIYGR